MSLHTPLLSESDFSLSKQELHQVFEPSGDQAVKRLGGVEGLAAHLQTSLSGGIDPDSISQRKAR
jgi:hypothetical protein